MWLVLRSNGQTVRGHTVLLSDHFVTVIVDGQEPVEIPAEDIAAIAKE